MTSSLFEQPYNAVPCVNTELEAEHCYYESIYWVGTTFLQSYGDLSTREQLRMGTLRGQA